MVDKWTGYCRVCVHTICRECKETEYLVCCACFGKPETHALSATDYCKYCAHPACEKCHDPHIIRAPDAEYSVYASEEEDTFEHYKEHGEENEDSEGPESLPGHESQGEEPNILCYLARFVEKIKCCGCGQELEKKLVLCETCGHEECQECHYLDELKD